VGSEDRKADGGIESPGAAAVAAAPEVEASVAPMENKRGSNEEEVDGDDDGGVCLADVAYDMTDPVGGYLPYEYQSPQAPAPERYTPPAYTPPTYTPPRETLISPEYLPRPPPAAADP